MLGFKKSFAGPSHLQLNLQEFQTEDFDEISYVQYIQGTRFLLLHKLPLAISIAASLIFYRKIKHFTDFFQRQHAFMFLNSDFKRRMNTEITMTTGLYTLNLMTFTSMFFISSF